MNDSDAPVCVRCGVPVVRERDHYETFEKMHWSCFHYEFEHDLGDGLRDPDIACADPSCPARAFDRKAQPTWFEGSPPSSQEESH
jgi:hypothetical protein